MKFNRVTKAYFLQFFNVLLFNTISETHERGMYYTFEHCLKRLAKDTKNIRTIGLWAEIWTRKFRIQRKGDNVTLLLYDNETWFGKKQNVSNIQAGDIKNWKYVKGLDN
jgi:hypothetical protein